MLTKLGLYFLIRLLAMEESTETNRQRVEPLFEIYDAGDGRGDAVPIGTFPFELLPPQARGRIIFGAAIVFAGLPLSPDPAAAFQFVERGVERAIADGQHVAGNLFQALADGP